MEVLRTFSEAFWNADIWLPPNTTWADIAPGSKPNIQYADSSHLLTYPVPFAIIVFLVRRFFEKYCFAAIGLYLGVRNNTPKRATSNPHIEKQFLKSKYPKKETIEGLKKQLDWSEMKIQRWFNTRRLQDKPTTLVKFTESSWRCLYYTFAFIMGCNVLWDKEWVWDIQKCWSNYPHQSVSNDIWWYYMISLSFYWSLSFSQFIDVKRSDFWQMFAHHLAVIALLCFSWVCNMTRIGTLVLITHDCADIILDGAKAVKYAKWHRLCNYMFIIFVPLWLSTRVGLFPFWILNNTLFEAVKVVPMFPAYYIFNFLLLILLGLHLFWTYLMFKLLMATLTADTMKRDVRSSSEENSD